MRGNSNGARCVCWTAVGCNAMTFCQLIVRVEVVWPLELTVAFDHSNRPHCDTLCNAARSGFSVICCGYSSYITVCLHAAWLRRQLMISSNRPRARAQCTLRVYRYQWERCALAMRMRSFVVCSTIRRKHESRCARAGMQQTCMRMRNIIAHSPQQRRRSDSEITFTPIWHVCIVRCCSMYTMHIWYSDIFTSPLCQSASMLCKFPFKSTRLNWKCSRVKGRRAGDGPSSLPVQTHGVC